MSGEQTPAPKAVVEIGLAEIYNLVLDVRENVVAMRSEQETEKEKVADHEARVRVLESTTVTQDDLRRAQTRTIAIVTTVCTVLGSIAAVVAIFVHV